MSRRAYAEASCCNAASGVRSLYGAANAGRTRTGQHRLGQMISRPLESRCPTKQCHHLFETWVEVEQQRPLQYLPLLLKCLTGQIRGRTAAQGYRTRRENPALLQHGKRVVITSLLAASGVAL